VERTRKGRGRGRGRSEWVEKEDGSGEEVKG